MRNLKRPFGLWIVVLLVFPTVMAYALTGVIVTLPLSDGAAAGTSNGYIAVTYDSKTSGGCLTQWRLSDSQGTTGWMDVSPFGTITKVKKRATVTYGIQFQRKPGDTPAAPAPIKPATVTIVEKQLLTLKVKYQ